MKHKGFTLIELMIVVAILGILAAIGIGAYIQYLQKASNSACLAEAKMYNYKVVVSLTNNDPVPATSLLSCERITFTDSNTDVTAFPKSPGNIGVRCPMDYSGTCRLDTSITN